MDFWNTGVGLMKTMVMGYGAYLCIIGGMGFAEGVAENNPAQKSAGGKLLISGVGVILVGMVMVPMLANMMTV